MWLTSQSAASAQLQNMPKQSPVTARRPALAQTIASVVMAIVGFAYSATAQSLTVGSYTLVRERSISRTVSEYEYRATLVNPSPNVLASVGARVVSVPSSTRLVDATLTFDNIPAGGSRVSTDTFIIRRRRAIPLVPSEFVWTLSVSAPNREPIARIATPAGPFSTGLPVTLDGRTSSDPDGTAIASFQWALITRPPASQATLGASASTAAFAPDVAGTYTVRLTVGDGVLSSSTSLTFSTANRPPVAAIVPVGQASIAQAVSLNGSDSLDPDRDALTFAWTVIARPAGSIATPQNATAATADFIPDRPGSYQIQLVVNDGVSSDSEVVVFATSNSPPVGNAGPPQSAAVGATITLDGSGSTDVDGDALTYEWSLRGRPVGSRSVLSDAVAVRPTFRVDVPGIYVFWLIVRDASVASQPSMVMVSTANSSPLANAGPDQAVASGDLVRLTGAESIDADGDPLSYRWRFVQAPPGSTAALLNATALEPTFVADRPGTFVVQLSVSDPLGAVSSDSITVTTGNTLPVANAGSDRSVALATIVQLEGSGSTDVDGDVLSYTWSFTSRPQGSQATLDSAAATRPTFVVDVPGLYTVQLVVTDAQGGSSIDTVAITTLNTRPLAHAGPDQSVTAGQPVALDGLRSLDADGDSLRFAWALTTRPAGSTAVLSNAADPRPSFIADRPGTFIAQLTVNDGALTSDADTVTITTGNTVPVANAGTDVLRTRIGDRVELDARGSRDADGNSLTYRWALLSRPAGNTVGLAASVGPTTSFVPDVGGDYVVQLTVHDGFLDSQPDTVLVRVNRLPTANAGGDRQAVAGVRVALDGGGSRDADQDPLAFSWTLSTPPGSAAFLTNPSSGTPSFIPDIAGPYTARLVVSDGLNESDSDDLVVTVDASIGIGLAPATRNTLTFSTVPLTVTTIQPAGPSGLVVSLSSSNASIARVPQTVTIPSGQISTTFDATTGASVGTATITASVPASAPTAAELAVVPRAMVVTLDATSVGVNRTIHGLVTLLDPAPAGGVTVTLASSAPQAVALSPGASVSAGATTLPFTVTGIGIGGAVVTARAPGYSDASTPVASTILLTLGPSPFEVERASTKVATLSLDAAAPTGGLSVTLSSDNPTRATVPASIVVPAGSISFDVVVTGVAEGGTTIRATAAGVQGASLAVTVKAPSAATIDSSPGNGEGSVAVTRETILRFSRALSNPGLITSTTLFAQFGGQVLTSRIHVSPDRKTVTLFYLQTLPASARVRVQLQTNGLVDDLGVPLDGDSDGQAGGLKLIDFDTLTLTTLPGTSVVGRVFASQLGDGGVNTPLAGVVISVDGLETTLRTTTNAMGNFQLNPAPVGEFFVHIDGRAATNGVPIGAYYPFVGKKWESKAGQTTTIPDVFLPLIEPGTLQPVSQTQDTVITFPPSVVAKDPRLADVRLTVPADSLYSDSGARGGMVGIAPVAPDRIPSPLPPGLNLPLVITVQTDGATNFDRPVPVCFPNLPDPTTGQTLPAGAKSALWSFNHDIGDWEIVGPMTVTQNGALVCTNPGVGIRQPGWHGSQPGTSLDYLINERILGKLDNACGGGEWNPFFCTGTWPPPGNINHDQGTGAYSTVGNQILHASEQEAADNKEAVRRAVNDSEFGIAIVGAAGGLGLGASVFSVFDDEKGFDHVAVAYRDPNDPSSILIRELLVGQNGENPNYLALFGGGHPGSRDLDTFAAAEDRVTAVPLNHVTPQEASRFIDIVVARTTAGNVWSFFDNGNTCSTVIAEAIRLSGIDASFGKGSPGYEHGTNTLLPESVVIFVAERNRVLGLLGGANGIRSAQTSGLSSSSVQTATSLTAPSALSEGLRFIPHFYYRIDSRGASATTFITLRGNTGSGSRLNPILPPFSAGYLILFDPLRNSVSAHPFETGSSGTVARELRTVFVGNAASDNDRDGDGLVDVGEYVIGTDPATADTDGDGISDGAEVQQGTNPLDGLAVQTGILATADTPGTAVDVAARNDVAVVADSDRGISVLNVAAGLNPVIVAQVDTPGTAQAVAFEGNLVAVADGPEGLAIVDISDPPAARIVRQVGPLVLGGAATSVAVAGGTAYVGLVGKVAAVDLSTGALLEAVTLDGEGAVQDVAIERDTLYALVVGRLYAIPLQAPLQVSGSVASPGLAAGSGRRLRLFTGGGTAFATHMKGYNTFSLAIPGQPVLIAAGLTNQFGWKQIIANGSGLGLAAVSPNSTNDGPHNVSLYDVSDPTQTDRFITEFETPGIAAAVSIYNGVGYVADSQAGLQVLNYLAFDRAGRAPTITLASNFSLNGTTGSAEEGKVMRLTANVSDDVQVRNVEFFVNGVLGARDGNFPFEHRFVTPLLGSTTSFTVRACAFDTGGNRTCTADIIVALVDDATPPRVIRVTPSTGSRFRQNSLSSLTATFSESIATTSLSASTFVLFAAGPDGQTGTADDVQVTGGAVSYNGETATAILSFSTPLPISAYRAVIRGAVTDFTGNPVGADFSWVFAVRGDKRWTSDVSGSWHVAANWSDNEVPQAGDFVVIDRPGANVVVTYSQGALSLNALTSTEALVISGNSDLSIEQSGQLTSLSFAGGTLSGAGTLTVGTFAWSGGQLAGTGTMTVTGASTVTPNGTTFITKKTLRLGTTTSWTGAPTGSAFSMNDGARLVNPPTGVWTVVAGSVDSWFSSGPASPETVNEGRLQVQAGNLAVYASFVNTGIVEMQAGTISLRGGGRSSGQVLGVAGTTFELSSGAFAFEAASQVSTSGSVRVSFGTVTVAGQFTPAAFLETGGVATFNANTGSIGTLTHSGGTINGSAEVRASTLVWNGGSFQGTGEIRVSGNSTISSGEIVGRRLRLGPTTTWSDFPLQMGSGASIVNAAGGLLDVSFDGLIFPAGVQARIENAGTLRRSGAGISDLSYVFLENSGTVELQSGALGLGQGSASGVFTGAASTRLSWSRGPFDLAASSSVTSAGDVIVDGGGNALIVRGAFSAARFTQQFNSSPEFLGPGPVIGTLVSDSGLMRMSTTSPASVGALILGGSIELTSSLNVNTLQWTGGGFGVFNGGGTVTVAGSTAFAPAGSLSLYNTHLALGSSSTWSGGGTLTVGPGATIEVGAGETFSIDGASQVMCNSGCTGASIQSLGTIRKTGTGLLEIGTTVDNAGLVDVTGGTLSINGGTSSGTFNVAIGTTLRLAGAATLGATSQVQAAGSVEFVGQATVGGSFSAGAVRVSGSATLTGSIGSMGLVELLGPTNNATLVLNTALPVSIPSLTMEQGILRGTAPLTTGSFSWSAGFVEIGSLTVTGSSTLPVSAGGRTFSGATLRFGASTTFAPSAGFALGAGASVINPAGGIWELQGDSTIGIGFGGGDGVVSNAGTFRMSGAASSFSVSGGRFVNTGTMRLRLGGTGAGQFDRVSVGSPTTLGGTLDVSTFGGFVPASGNTFDVMTYQSRTGQFSTISGNGRTYTPTYGTSALTLTVP